MYARGHAIVSLKVQLADGADYDVRAPLRIFRLCRSLRPIINAWKSQKDAEPLQLRWLMVKPDALRHVVRFGEAYCELFPHTTSYELDESMVDDEDEGSDSDGADHDGAECRPRGVINFGTVWSYGEIDDDALRDLLRAADFLLCDPLLHTLLDEFATRFADRSLTHLSEWLARTTCRTGQ